MKKQTHTNGKKDSFHRSQMISNLGLWIAHGCNFAFYLFSLLLSAEQFAEVVTLISLSFFLSIAQSANKNYVIGLAKKVKNQAILLHRCLRSSAILGALLTILYIAAAPILQNFLHFESAFPFVLVGLSGIPYLLNGLIRGMLTVQKRFVGLCGSAIMETAARLPLGLAFFMTAGYNPADTGWIILFTAVCMFALGCGLIRDDIADMMEIRKTEARGSLAVQMGRVCTIMFSGILIGFALKIDVLWAKHALDAAEAGTYGVLNTIAVFLFFGTAGIAQASLAYMNPKTIKHIALLSYTGITLAAGAALAFFVFIGDPVIALVFGEQYTGHIHDLLFLLTGVMGYCLISFNYQAMTVLKRTEHVPLSIFFVATQIACLNVWGDSLHDIVMVQLSTMVGYGALFTFVLLVDPPSNEKNKAYQPFSFHSLIHSLAGH